MLEHGEQGRHLLTFLLHNTCDRVRIRCDLLCPLDFDLPELNQLELELLVLSLVNDGRQILLIDLSIGKFLVDSVLILKDDSLLLQLGDGLLLDFVLFDEVLVDAIDGVG